MKSTDEISLWAEREDTPTPITSSRTSSLSGGIPTGEGFPVVERPLDIWPVHQHLFGRIRGIVSEKCTYDTAHPKGWYINRDGTIIAGLPLGFTKKQIAALWKQFPGGWYIGNQYIVTTSLCNIHTYVRGKVGDVLAPDESINEAGIGVEIGELLMQIRSCISRNKGLKSYNPDKPNSFLEALGAAENILSPHKRGQTKRTLLEKLGAVQGVIDVFPRGKVITPLQHLIFNTSTTYIHTNHHPIEIKENARLLLSLVRIRTLLERKILRES